MKYVTLFQDGLYLLSATLYTQELLLLDCSQPSGCLAPTGGELSSLFNSNFHWWFSGSGCKQRTDNLPVNTDTEEDKLPTFIYFLSALGLQVVIDCCCRNRIASSHGCFSFIFIEDFSSFPGPQSHEICSKCKEPCKYSTCLKYIKLTKSQVAEKITDSSFHLRTFT